MDKIKISSMGAPVVPESRYLDIGAASVEVKPIIPYEEVLDMIQWCIDLIINDRPFLSAPLKRIVKDLAVLKFYTNFDLSFLDEFHDMTDIYSEYDLVKSFNVIDAITPLIDADQLKFFNETLDETLVSIVDYRNSAIGVIDTLADNAGDDISKMEGALNLLKDPEENKKLANLIEAAHLEKEPMEEPAKE